jgi:hypothetical protein
MRRLLTGALLCFLLFCSINWAQKKSEYRTGHLLKVENVNFATYPGDSGTAHKADVLVYIREGSDDHVARYSVTFFGHDKSELLKPDTDVSFRISGKSLFVRTADGKEIKAQLCERSRLGLKCGNMTLLGRDTP